MPVFFIHSTQVDDERITISDPLFSHLSKSLRMRPGDQLILNDERNCRYHTTILQITKQAIYSTVLSIQESPLSSTTPITLAQAILKGEKMAWVIQKATELGVHALVPLITERVIPRVSPSHATNYQERWDRIALEAAQQSERWSVPKILPIQTFQDFLRQKNKGIQIMLAERQEKASLSTIALPSDDPNGISVFIGPEGGWTKEEREIAKNLNVVFATLGQGILRAETASLASLVILQARLKYL
ncbi:16S rRNA (uracil(1498)-N(3))-methyltransferase [Candidatus Nitrospira neomarina]|uniref:Ribosomal RNA small subunit methyltransferase E n=1 Tax=Candidatus Nitrospira neomarina TaxID=3020899 RepID=A0AA96GRY4_9BACT|nr:16S rRNA (uracil(1498)-N(3))-methyltransferase [Candidatus Nitrospira neomarina]WNM62989.1 16S rRNA (uracil(1498)-N(3))-methyltransferase [Candidatus Nitrospira neomarina]